VEEISIKGSKLVISDAGVAAAMCRACAEGAAMNVFINTKLMKNRGAAGDLNREAEKILSACVKKCAAVYEKISNELRGAK